jgi:nucleotide-binding universal stress UspA family protein
MKLLAWVDGSQWSDQALAHLVRWLSPEDSLLLLYVAPRAKAGYLECGRMVFEAALHHGHLDTGDGRVRCRLEIGDAATRILAVCQEERPDVLAMGFAAADGFPYLTEVGETARAVWEECPCPILLASPRGIELLVTNERLLTTPRIPPPPPPEVTLPSPAPPPASAPPTWSISNGHATVASS